MIPINLKKENFKSLRNPPEPFRAEIRIKDEPKPLIVE
jgi:hypothetical protein